MPFECCVILFEATIRNKLLLDDTKKVFERKGLILRFQKYESAIQSRVEIKRRKFDQDCRRLKYWKCPLAQNLQAACVSSKSTNISKTVWTWRENITHYFPTLKNFPNTSYFILGILDILQEFIR